MRRRRVLPEAGRVARFFRANVLVTWSCLVTCLVCSLVTINYSMALALSAGYKFDA